MAYLTQMSLLKKIKILHLDHFALINVGMTLWSKQIYNVTLHFGVHYNHNGAGIKV